tara:strand:- start:5600 stop:5953 length:354 start_codon:yes stop_codon:yes gene_type:complete
MPQQTITADGSDDVPESLILSEIQVILAEKRTSLSTLRTGIAVFALPLSVLSVLIATSRLYEVSAVMHWLFPLLILTIGLVALGIYLVTTAIRRIQHFNRLLDDFKTKYTRLARLLD